MIEIIPPDAPFMTEWGVHPTEETKLAYVELEVDRMMEAGEPVFHLGFMLPLSEQVNAVMSALVARQYSPRLRLHEGVSPPLKDANGKDVPEKLAGKVLIGKTGTMGAPEKASPAEIKQWSAARRQYLVNMGKPIIRQKTIGFDRAGVPCTIDEAVTLMRMWGIGCRNPRFSKIDETIKRDDDGNIIKTPTMRDHWMLEEVTDAMLERERSAAPEKPARARRGEETTAQAGG